MTITPESFYDLVKNARLRDIQVEIGKWDLRGMHVYNRQVGPWVLTVQCHDSIWYWACTQDGYHVPTTGRKLTIGPNDSPLDILHQAYVAMAHDLLEQVFTTAAVIDAMLPEVTSRKAV